MALCVYVVPRLIESAYYGNSLAVFNRMMTGQALHPVGDYLVAWNRIRWWLLADLILLGLVTIVIIRPEFRRIVWGTDSTDQIQEPEAGSGVRGAHMLALAGYLLLAIFFTLPASLYPSRALLGDGADNYVHSWLLWNFAHSVIHAHSPFHTNLILYPHGANLAWAPSDPLVGLMVLPLSLWFAPAITYNVALILQFTLAAFFARLLGLRVCGNPTAATIGGMVFGFSPYMMEQSLGHLSSLTTFPIPIYVLALGRLLGKERPTWRDGALLGLALMLVATGNYQNVLFCLMFTAVVLVVDLGRERMKLVQRTLTALVVAAGTFLLCFSPLLAAMFLGPGGMPKVQAVETDWREKFSADLLGFFIPSRLNPFLGRYARTLPKEFFVSGHEGVVYTGIVALILAGIGACSARGVQRVWAGRAVVAGLVSAALSLGPTVHLLGRSTLLPAPAALLYKASFMRFLREPGRFSIILTLCLSLLAAMGFSFVLERYPLRWQRYLLIGLVASGLVTEYNTLPFHASSVIDPGLYSATPTTTQRCTMPPWIKDSTVLTVPLFDWRHYHNAMWMQEMDGGRYRLVDGNVSPYVPTELYEHTPVIRVLLKQGADALTPPPDQALAASVVKSLQLSAAVVFEASERPAEMNYVRQVFGGSETMVGTCAIFDFSRNNPTTPDAHYRSFSPLASHPAARAESRSAGGALGNRLRPRERPEGDNPYFRPAGFELLLPDEVLVQIIHNQSARIDVVR